MQQLSRLVDKSIGQPIFVVSVVDVRCICLRVFASLYRAGRRRARILSPGLACGRSVWLRGSNKACWVTCLVLEATPFRRPR